MLVTTQTGRIGRLRDRTRLYHIVRFIGRWSMIDIFMESLLGALVAFGSVITIQPGMGALAFCAVVILTMFAAETFDPRLMWDARTRPGRGWAHRRRRTGLDNRDPIRHDRKTPAARGSYVLGQDWQPRWHGIPICGGWLNELRLDSSHAVRTDTRIRFSRALLVLALVPIGFGRSARSAAGRSATAGTAACDPAAGYRGSGDPVPLVSLDRGRYSPLGHQASERIEHDRAGQIDTAISPGCRSWGRPSSATTNSALSPTLSMRR